MSKKPVVLRPGQARVGMAVRTTNANQHGVVIRVHLDWHDNEVVIVESPEGRFAVAPGGLVKAIRQEEGTNATPL